MTFSNGAFSPGGVINWHPLINVRCSDARNCIRFIISELDDSDLLKGNTLLNATTKLMYCKVKDLVSAGLISPIHYPTHFVA